MANKNRGGLLIKENTVLEASLKGFFALYRVVCEMARVAKQYKPIRCVMNQSSYLLNMRVRPPYVPHITTATPPTLPYIIFSVNNL